MPGQVWLSALGIPVASLGVLLVLGLWFDLLGPGDALLGLALAIVPLAIVIAGILWVDRWEREPRWAIVFAFLWGAGFCALIGVFVGVDLSVAGRTGELLAAIVQAPLVEELAKGFALVILLLAARRQIDGPVDGIVYAAWTAAGFAFVENILYFGVEFARGGDVTSLFIIRGLMSPFAHLMFGACVGIAVGIAVRRGWATPRVLGAWLLGLIPAVGLHVLWNGALYVVGDFVVYFLLVQVPLFAGMVGLVFWFREQERRIIVLRLSEFAAEGRLAAGEVDAVATRAGRERALQWARRSGRQAAMRDYLRSATRLAFAGQRAVVGAAATEVEVAFASFDRARTRLHA